MNVRKYGQLKELIRKQFKTLDDFATAIGISRSALSKKLNGISDWSCSEIENICKVLGIPMAKVSDYFFYEV